MRLVLAHRPPAGKPLAQGVEGTSHRSRARLHQGVLEIPPHRAARRLAGLQLEREPMGIEASGQSCTLHHLQTDAAFDLASARPLRCALASYIAMSALRSNDDRFSPSRGKTATPMLAPTITR